MVLVNLISRGSLALLESIGAVLYIDTFDAHTKHPTIEASYFFLYLGLVGLATYLVMPTAAKWWSPVILLGLGLLLSAAGCFLLLPFTSSYRVSKAQVILGSGLIWCFGQPITGSLAISTFSTMMGAKPQGTAMGVIGAAGSLGRILLPLAMPEPSEIPTRADVIRAISTLSFAAVLFLVCCAGMGAMYWYRVRRPAQRQST
jgi:hypothetical protein